MVSRFRAFTIAVGWIATGLAVGIAALYLAGNGMGDDGPLAAATDIYRAGFLWWLVLVPGCVIVAGLWIGLSSSRSARTSASLGAQGALIGLATALIALLLLLIAGQVLGGPVL